MGCRDGGQEGLRGPTGPGGIGARQEDAELVAADPGDRPRAAQGITEPRPDPLEEEVAVVMTERVVDLLEAVEVDQQQREGDARFTAFVEISLQLGLELSTVEQAGQCVVRRLIRQPLLGPFALGDVRANPTNCGGAPSR